MTPALTRCQSPMAHIFPSSGVLHTGGQAPSAAHTCGHSERPADPLGWAGGGRQHDTTAGQATVQLLRRHVFGPGGYSHGAWRRRDLDQRTGQGQSSGGELVPDLCAHRRGGVSRPRLSSVLRRAHGQAAKSPPHLMRAATASGLLVPSGGQEEGGGMVKVRRRQEASESPHSFLRP